MAVSGIGRISGMLSRAHNICKAWNVKKSGIAEPAEKWD
jgi:hypothetical protein